MTNQQIIIAIVLALISAFSKLIFEKILEPYIPERKILSSYIKNFFLFLFLYILPIASIIYTMKVATTVDKTFVLAIMSGFFILSINICVVVSNITLQRLMKSNALSTKEAKTTFEFLINLDERLSNIEKTSTDK